MHVLLPLLLIIQLDVVLAEDLAQPSIRPRVKVELAAIRNRLKAIGSRSQPHERESLRDRINQYPCSLGVKVTQHLEGIGISVLLLKQPYPAVEATNRSFISSFRHKRSCRVELILSSFRNRTRPRCDAIYNNHDHKEESSDRKRPLATSHRSVLRCWALLGERDFERSTCSGRRSLTGRLPATKDQRRVSHHAYRQATTPMAMVRPLS